MRIDDLIVKTKSRGVDRESDTLNENRHRRTATAATWKVEGLSPLRLYLRPPCYVVMQIWVKIKKGQSAGEAELAGGKPGIGISCPDLPD